MVVSTTLALLVLGLFVSTRRRLLESLRERAERLERERYLLAEQAIATERTRIAREMHDAVAHRVSLIVPHAGGLGVATAESSTATTAELIRRTGRQALGELRDVLGVLREDSVIAAPKHPRSELEDIRELIAQWREAGMRVEFHPNASSIEDLAPKVRRMAFHVVEEALTNAAKHATGAQVCVRLDRLDRALRVEVVNGAAPEAAPLGPPERIRLDRSS